MSSSGTTIATPAAVQTVLTNIASTAQTGLTSAVTAALEDLTGDSVGLAGEEVQDFDNFVDNLTEGLEAGQSWSAAWSSASSQLVTTEKSQLMTAALNGLSQLSGIFDSFAKTLEAIL